MIKDKHFSKSSGFTLVELMIVVVVIAILASIGYVAYGGAQDRAREAVLRSDLTAAAELLNLDRVRGGGKSFPASLGDVDNSNGIPASADTVYYYTANNAASPPEFCLTGHNGMIALYITHEGVINEGSCDGDPDPVAQNGDGGDGSGPDQCVGDSLPNIGLAVRDYRHEVVATPSDQSGLWPATTEVQMPNIKNGDLVLIHVSWDGGGVVTGAREVAPEGFSKLSEWMGDDSFMNSVVWWAIADCLPSSLSVSIRHNEGVHNKISVISISGVQSVQPVVAVNGAPSLDDPSATDPVTSTLPTLSTTSASSSGIDVRIGYTRFGSNTSWTPPLGYTEIIDHNVGSQSSTTVAYRILSASGPTGIRNFTASNNDQKMWTGYTVTAAAD